MSRVRLCVVCERLLRSSGRPYEERSVGGVNAVARMQQLRVRKERETKAYA